MLKFASGGCASGVGLVGVNHAQIRWNFARSDCKSRRALPQKPQKSQKEGVWEDTRMLKFAQGLCLRR